MQRKKPIQIKNIISSALTIALLCLISGCGNRSNEHSMVVTATAYTLNPKETTKHHIGLAAWGDKIKPGMKAIAVSRDLIKKGLTHNTIVKISGLAGTYKVMDKMNKRWRKRIDIFMGNNRAMAKNWGKRQVTIYWTTSKNKK